MTADEILEIIKAFFQAIIRIFNAIKGISGSDDETASDNA